MTTDSSLTSLELQPSDANVMVRFVGELNENLKFFVVQSFYYEHRHLLKKQIRDENIKNFLKILKTHLISNKEMSVFSGKIGVFNKKTCINLT